MIRDKRQNEQQPDAWKIVERAYAETRHSDHELADALPKKLSPFQRELVAAAFAVGRRSYAEDCDQSTQFMRELGLTADA